MAADKGFAISRERLANLYWVGEEVEMDREYAFKLYEQAMVDTAQEKVNERFWTMFDYSGNHLRIDHVPDYTDLYKAPPAVLSLAVSEAALAAVNETVELICTGNLFDIGGALATLCLRRVCDHCHADTFLAEVDIESCNGCGLKYYCEGKCAFPAWPAHKAECLEACSRQSAEWRWRFTELMMLEKGKAAEKGSAEAEVAIGTGDLFDDRNALAYLIETAPDCSVCGESSTNHPRVTVENFVLRRVRGHGC